MKTASLRRLRRNPQNLMTLVLSTLLLATGCGVSYYDDRGRPRGPAAGEPALFLIDPGVGVDLPERHYAVTTNGQEWTLAWIGSTRAHRFSGQVVSGTTIDNVLFAGGFPSDRVTQTRGGEVAFEAVTDFGNLQSITLRSASEPLRFNLFIDGQAAIGQVVFSSQGVASTTDEMPFELTTSVLAKSEPAAAFASAPKADSRSLRARHVPAPPPAQ